MPTLLQAHDSYVSLRALLRSLSVSWLGRICQGQGAVHYRSYRLRGGTRPTTDHRFAIKIPDRQESSSVIALVVISGPLEYIGKLFITDWLAGAPPLIDLIIMGIFRNLVTKQLPNEVLKYNMISYFLEYPRQLDPILSIR
jgi:hypothetical protein